jgi:plasmid stabilization system protein ParE
LRIVWSFDANNDIEQIWTYLAQNASVDRADRQIIKIVEACRLVSDWPRSDRSRAGRAP